MDVIITKLDPDELECAKLLGTLIDKMTVLGKRRRKVYERWRQLHLLTNQDLTAFELNIQRVNDTSGTDRRFK